MNCKGEIVSNEPAKGGMNEQRHMMYRAVITIQVYIISTMSDSWNVRLLTDGVIRIESVYS